jgi:hypothetical protein
MAFDNITTAELSVGKPLTNELMEKFKNRDDFLNAQVGTISGISISNPSFEVDSDGDGQPDNWTITFHTGGTGSIDTSTAVHGAVSYKFTHPGGAGNGGGYMDSDFFPVSTNYGYTIEYEQNVKGGAVPDGGVLLYDKNQSLLGSIQIPFSSLVFTTGVFRPYVAGFYPALSNTVVTAVSSAVYAKVRLEGGSTDHSSAGTINYDNIRVTPIGISSPGDYVVYRSQQQFSPTTGSTLLTAIVTKPGGFRIAFTASSTVTLAGNKVEYRVNSSKFSSASFNTSNTPTTVVLDAPGTVSRRFVVNDSISIYIVSANTVVPVPVHVTNLRFGSHYPGYGGLGATLA